MRNVINNHLYDTEIDTLIGHFDNGKANEGVPVVAGDYYGESLYRNGGGSYYLHIIAGIDAIAGRKYYGSSTDFTGGSHGMGAWISPITAEEAQEWQAKLNK